MNNGQVLKAKIEKKQARICIIGLGYVGLPLAVAFGRKGYSVIGLDSSKSRIDRLNKGKQYIVDVDFKEVLSLIKENKFGLSNNYPNFEELLNEITTNLKEDIQYGI